MTKHTDILNVKLRLPRLNEIWENFENVQDGFESLKVEPSKHDEYRSEFKILFYEVNVALTCLIEENDVRVLQGQDRRSLEGSVHSNNNHHSHIKLPPIELPTFNGGHEHWISFSDMFKAMVHDHETLTDIQICHYLKSSLTGEAGELVSSLAMSSSNYKIAWQRLIESITKD
jgi:hypothetical protein